MFKLKYKPPKPEEGFSLIEVLVTALVLVGFLLGGLQAITLATLLRVQAQAKSEAVNWINNDKTKIEYEAFSVPAPSGTPPVTNANCTLATFQSFLQSNGYPNEESIPPLLNKNTYKVARIYTIITSNNTLQITWHLWDEGTNDINPDPNLDGTGGDSDDRSIAVITTEVVPNISSCN